MTAFRAWFDEAVERGAPFADAMTLATATADGAPSARVVLYKGIDDGILFYTSYESRKASELEDNPRAALVFYWPILHRQVRIEGRVERVTAALSDAYFATRPRESQLGAWASPQSRAVASREALDESFSELDRHWAGRSVERPPFWGGYRLLPQRVELWIGREARLHDRFVYERAGNAWQRTRLGP
jgi:pyridoxamine 5'-phosphate oxidase